MEIYILRHGDAEPRSAEVEEADRKLTAKGRHDVENVMRAAAACKVAPEIVLTSPYRRAIETAQLAMRELESKPKLIQTDVLLPEGRVEQVWKELRGHAATQEILLAGHEPQFSQLVAYLLAAPSLHFDFKKGALVRITMDRVSGYPHGELKWIVTPSFFRE